MLTTVPGTYREGRVTLSEKPRGVRADTRVLVTFLEPNLVDLKHRGIAPAQAADLRLRLATFAQDWDSPDMDVYIDCDAWRRDMARLLRDRQPECPGQSRSPGAKAAGMHTWTVFTAALSCRRSGPG
jgi:hypothetical protein